MLNFKRTATNWQVHNKITKFTLSCYRLTHISVKSFDLYQRPLLLPAAFLVRDGSVGRRPANGYSRAL